VSAYNGGPARPNFKYGEGVERAAQHARRVVEQAAVLNGESVVEMQWLRAPSLHQGDMWSSLIFSHQCDGCMAGALAGSGPCCEDCARRSGAYVSVASRADAELADPALERTELAAEREAEEQELAAIYGGRGLEPAPAHSMAQRLIAHDALAAHARDELRLSEKHARLPIQTVVASAATFAAGAILPIATTMVIPERTDRTCGIDGFVALPCRDERAGCESWWRLCMAWRNPCRVLRRTGHGHNSLRRGAVRNNCELSEGRRERMEVAQLVESLVDHGAGDSGQRLCIGRCRVSHS
jgi:hypothetical protein